jgi:hypothetical protein
MECVMRKISKATFARSGRVEADGEFINSGSGRVQGSTITSWPGPPVIDLAALFSRPMPSNASNQSPADPVGATITGATGSEVEQPKRPQKATVSLSDGTTITFTTAERGAIVDVA